MEKNLQLVTMSNLVESFHQNQVVVDSNRVRFKDWSHFKLVWSNFIVSGLDWNTQFVQFQFSFRQSSKNTGWNLSEIVVIKLLMLWWNVTNQSTSTDFQ